MTYIVPDLSYLYIWECKANLYLPKKTLVKSEKFYPINKKSFFISYNSYLWLL